MRKKNGGGNGMREAKGALVEAGAGDGEAAVVGEEAVGIGSSADEIDLECIASWY